MKRALCSIGFGVSATLLLFTLADFWMTVHRAVTEVGQVGMFYAVAIYLATSGMFVCWKEYDK